MHHYYSNHYYHNGDCYHNGDGDRYHTGYYRHDGDDDDYYYRGDGCHYDSDDGYYYGHLYYDNGYFNYFISFLNPFDLNYSGGVIFYFHFPKKSLIESKILSRFSI